VGVKGAAKAGGEQAAFALVRWIAGKTDGKVAADLSRQVSSTVQSATCCSMEQPDIAPSPHLCDTVPAFLAWIIHDWCLDYPDTRGVDRFFSSTGPPPVVTLKKGSLD